MLGIDCVSATCLQSFDIELHATNLLLLQSSHMKQHKKGIRVAGGGDLDIWSRILLINIVGVV